MVDINEVRHDESRHCFILAIDHDAAILEYRKLAGNIVDFTHTYVPVAFRGRGFAEHLVRHGLKWAREQGYDIQASCWYVGKFLRRQS